MDGVAGSTVVGMSVRWDGTRPASSPARGAFVHIVSYVLYKIYDLIDTSSRRA